MPADRRPCDKCGQPALVHITSDRGQSAAMRHLCLECAAAEDSPASTRGGRLNVAALYLTVGLMILVLSAAADHLRLGLQEGFGVWQITGLAIGGALLLVGALIRAATVLVIGLAACLLTALADSIRLGGNPGFGAEQIIGCVVGGILILRGVFLASRGR